MKYIHECGQHLDLEETGIYNCPNCGKQFEFQIPPQDQNICQYCKSPLPDGATKCAHCGEWVEGEKPKDRTTYLLLSFFLGHLGVAEFYAGNIFLGGIYLILTLLCCGLQIYPAVAVVAIFQFIVAIFSKVGENKDYKPTKTDKIIPILCLVIASVFILSFAGFVYYCKITKRI